MQPPPKGPECVLPSSDEVWQAPAGYIGVCGGARHPFHRRVWWPAGQQWATAEPRTGTRSGWGTRRYGVRAAADVGRIKQCGLLLHLRVTQQLAFGSEVWPRPPSSGRSRRAPCATVQFTPDGLLAWWVRVARTGADARKPSRSGTSVRWAAIWSTTAPAAPYWSRASSGRPTATSSSARAIWMDRVIRGLPRSTATLRACAMAARAVSLSPSASSADPRKAQERTIFLGALVLRARSSAAPSTSASRPCITSSQVK